MNPKPIGSMIGSMRWGTPQRSRAATVGSRVSSPVPKSGIATTRAFVPASSRAASRLEPFTLSTSSAPAATASRISPGSNESMLTRIPAATSSPTTALRSGYASPGVQPTSMTSAPLAR